MVDGVCEDRASCALADAVAVHQQPGGRGRHWPFWVGRYAVGRRRATGPPVPATGSTRRQHTVYECGECGQRLAGEQWCTDCQRPARRTGPGGSCPSCGDPVTIADLTEPPMP